MLFGQASRDVQTLSSCQQ